MVGEKVLVTGITGYVAAHAVDVLVSQGYSIVGTVRSLAKGDFFLKKYPQADLKLSVVKDVAEPGAFDETFKNYPDIKYVLHLASPFRYDVKNVEEELLKPAIRGTAGILESANKFGPNVKKIVITSSIAAMMDNPNHYHDTSYVYNEKSWNPITYDEAKLNPYNGYVGSKKLAEKAAWDFVKETKPKFTITTVQLALVLGPPINQIGIGSLNTSSEYVFKYLDAKDKKNVEPIGIPVYVDVRDAALGHVKALQTDKADNKRWFLSAGTFSGQGIVNAVREGIPEISDRLPVGDYNYAAEYAASLCKFDNSKTTEESGITYKPFKTTIVDHFKTFLKFEGQL